MERFKKYGTLLLLAIGAVGLVLVKWPGAFGLPIWLSIFVAAFGPMLATLVIGCYQFHSWVSEIWFDDDDLAQEQEQARLGQDFLDRAARGNPVGKL